MLAPLLALAVLLADIGGGAPPPPPPQVVAAQDLERLARDVLVRVEKLRAQKLKKPLAMGVKSKPQVTRFIQERLDEEYGPAKVAAEGRMLQISGLLPPAMDYGGFVTALLTEQVAGFYDHTRQELHIADWLAPILQESVLSHEIFHAIQDQEWGGGKLIDSKVHTHDAVLAHAALLEGDATLVMLNYQQGDMGVDLSTSAVTINLIAAALPLEMISGTYPVMASAPDYLKQSLIFPYQQGLLFVAALRQGGLSWAQIRDVYKDPPNTTEQILHPERYFRERDRPSEVKVAPLGLPGFERTWDGRAGEYHFRQLLLAQLDTADAAEAAAGWDGDLTFLEVSKASGFVASASTWDTAEEAAAFLRALQDAHARRLGTDARAPTLAQKLDGTEVYFVLAEDAALAPKALVALTAATRVTRR